MRSNIFRDQFFSFETGGVNQGNVSTKAVGCIVLPVPPIVEQEKIADQVDSLFALVDRIESNCEHLKKHFDRLPEAILSSAFRGELVKDETKKLKVHSQDVADLTEATALNGSE